MESQNNQSGFSPPASLPLATTPPHPNRKIILFLGFTLMLIIVGFFSFFYFLNQSNEKFIAENNNFKVTPSIIPTDITIINITPPETTTVPANITVLPTAIPIITQYANPFDENNQYVNPFSENKNPFDNLK